ncbi:MAG: transposase [Firmicutes bacterium]|nr:transposase [Bacillota bacterium]
MGTLPQRKNIRLQNYDYSKPGYYFITICTHNMQNLLGVVVGGIDPYVRLSNIGKQVEANLLKLPEIYTGIVIKPHVVMPNHVHFIVQLTAKHRGLPLPKLIGRFKSYTTKLYPDILWQRSYYDRVIRNEKEYLAICEYIQTNPLRWELDRYYSN